MEPSDAVAVQAARDAAGDAVDAFDVSCVLEDILQKVELFEGLCDLLAYELIMQGGVHLVGARQRDA